MTGDEFEAPPRSGPAHSGSHFQPAPRLAVLLLVLFVGSLVGVFRYVNPISVAGHVVQPGTTTTSTASNTTTTTIATHLVKVQVANGTTVSGLARTFTDKLQLNGWDVLGPLNASHITSTTVFYRPGFRWAAERITRQINVGQSAVQPKGGDALKIAGNAGDDVIVILGPNSAHG